MFGKNGLFTGSTVVDLELGQVSEVTQITQKKYTAVTDKLEQCNNPEMFD